jgi:hypothetical protein
MELRAVGFVVCRGLAEHQHCDEERSGEGARQDLYSLARGWGAGLVWQAVTAHPGIFVCGNITS